MTAISLDENQLLPAKGITETARKGKTIRPPAGRPLSPSLRQVMGSSRARAWIPAHLIESLESLESQK